MNNPHQTFKTALVDLENSSEFIARHIGLNENDQAKMLQMLNAQSMNDLMKKIVPAGIARQNPMDLPKSLSEADALAELKQIASHNQLLRSHIGQGYYPNHTPNVILRNVLENPAWYTAYTPYQAEISQGRMEALVNFQTMICDLTGMPIANASMLDEATAAAEAMTLAKRSVKSKSNTILIHADNHPQTIEVIQTRAKPLGLEVKIIETPDWTQALESSDYFATLVSYPQSSGEISAWEETARCVHEHQAALIVASDLLALTLLKPPGEWGADLVIGSTQRFGMPMGFGGPHAAFIACQDEFKRSLPGRLIGVSIDAHGSNAYRLALQTREQHIRREKATSNICTAQVLPAVVASMYAVYHGAKGLTKIAQRIAAFTAIFKRGLSALHLQIDQAHAFDTLTLRVTLTEQSKIRECALAAGVNLRYSTNQHNKNNKNDSKESSNDKGFIGISFDETTTREHIETLWKIIGSAFNALNSHPKNKSDLSDLIAPSFDEIAALINNEQQSEVSSLIPALLSRKTSFLTHPVFNQYQSETSLLRYLRALSDKDLALDRSMIPLGSCTMKLNATSEMIPITWAEFANVHPFAPANQTRGYQLLDEQLRRWLCEATGYSDISLQPNAGSQGEYAGLLMIQAWHESRGESERRICLIPASAHGTNPASAQMAGLQVVVTACDAKGNIDLKDLKAKCEQHSARLSCVMVTYPSTHGVFETHIKELCDLVHEHGGRVYLDGANMNALVGLAAPGLFGGDVTHLNLHKTFCIPHGGGGPGVGPVCVVEDLVPFLPVHQTALQSGSYLGVAQNDSKESLLDKGNASISSEYAIHAISAAPLGNAAVLPISWMYCRMMGEAGLTQATQAAILSANYISHRLKNHFATLYQSENGFVAHECILDLRPLKETSGVTAEDVAKRLIDYGFHAPTLSFPVAGTLMIEPTESESLLELDRFIDAMIQIREEIAQVEKGVWSKEDNPLKNAPHTAAHLLEENWQHAYKRELAAYPLASLRQNKYWSPVARVDNVWGDRNLFCSCIPVSDI